MMRSIGWAGLTCLLLGLASPARAGDEVLHYVAFLQSLNDSGVNGVAVITVQGKLMEVVITASGLEPGKPHPQHIHGHNRPKRDATCPPPEADVNGDGVVDVREGAPFYGPVIVPLTPFDTVDADGNLNYVQTFEIRPQDVKPLHKRAIVLHGLTVGEAYVPSLPVACGEVVEVLYTE